ncbi:MAG TPA: efflux RND transporter periplasmic adaptor subunit [Steroidobacteraceae bacterium]|nr:efflux RND transporter periplasmic adaptor subunit [Steroidobacteraceae bacterium]
MTIPLRLSRTRLVLGAAAIAAVALFAWLLAPAHASSQHQDTPAAVAVSTAPVVRADVPIYLEGIGTVQAFYTVKVTAQVNGELTNVAFHEGQQVRRGQLLAQIDPRPFQAALDEARAALAKDNAQLADARKDLGRYVYLEPKKLASQQQVDTQRAQVGELEAQTEADRAAIESAATELSYTRITSPIEGRTGIRQVDPGNIVHATDTNGIVVLTQLQPITAIFTLPEDSLEAVAGAMAQGPVAIAALAEGEELDRGTVQLIDNQIDPTSGTIRLKAVFPNQQLKLWPGQFVNLRLLVRTDRGALTIPAAALQRGPDGTFVYIVRPDSTVAMQPVTVANNSETTAIVTQGLELGQQVVTSNLFRLQAGAAVRVLPSASKHPAATTGAAATAYPQPAS